MVITLPLDQEAIAARCWARPDHQLGRHRLLGPEREGREQTDDDSDAPLVFSY